MNRIPASISFLASIILGVLAGFSVTSCVGAFGAGMQAGLTGEFDVPGDDVVGCTNILDAMDLDRYVRQKDPEAVRLFMQGASMKGTCETFAKGERLLVMTQEAGGSGVMCVRRRGELTKYWVSTAMIK